MIITLTGIFYYELVHSLDNFKVTVHETHEDAVKFIYKESYKYLKKCKCVCEEKKKCVNCPKEQLKHLKRNMDENDEYDKMYGYGCNYSEFQYKIINY